MTCFSFFCFRLISFIHIHGAVVVTKQVDCKIRTKKTFLKKTFRDFFVLFCDVLNWMSKLKRVEKFRTQLDKADGAL